MNALVLENTVHGIMIGIKHFSFYPTNSVPRPELSWTSFLERTLKTPQGHLARLYKKYKAKFKYHSHNNDVWLLITDFGNKANTILSSLLDKTYKVSSPEQFEFTDAQKKRVYEKYSVEDGLVINLLFHWLKEKLSCRRSDSYYQCEGKGVKKAFNRLKRKATKYRYIYKTDVYSYYASIDQVKLSGLLEEELQDKEVVHLIMSIVRASERYEKENASTKGIPLGCSLSMLLAEFYLRKLDKHFEKQSSDYYYQRFNDDIIVLSKTKRSLRKSIKHIHQILREHGLHIRREKTYIGKTSDIISYLGYRLLKNMPVGASKERKRRAKERQYHRKKYERRKTSDLWERNTDHRGASWRGKQPRKALADVRHRHNGSIISNEFGCGGSKGKGF